MSEEIVKHKNGKTYNELGTKPPKQPPAAEGATEVKAQTASPSSKRNEWQ